MDGLGGFCQQNMFSSLTIRHVIQIVDLSSGCFHGTFGLFFWYYYTV